ncbi:MAG: hypothetical protein ACRDSZ_09115, partial [Pseudonocardiaceae bacterium]
IRSRSRSRSAFAEFPAFLGIAHPHGVTCGTEPLHDGSPRLASHQEPSGRIDGKFSAPDTCLPRSAWQ